MSDFFYMLLDNRRVHKPSFNIYTCRDIFKWIKQSFDSWNSIQNIIVKITELSRSLGRSLHKYYNKIYFIFLWLISFSINFKNSWMDKYTLGKKFQTSSLSMLHAFAMAARCIAPGKSREEDGGSLTGRRGVALVVNLGGGRRGRARGGGSGRGLLGSSKQKGGKRRAVTAAAQRRGGSTAPGRRLSDYCSGGGRRSRAWSSAAAGMARTAKLRRDAVEEENDCGSSARGRRWLLACWSSGSAEGNNSWPGWPSGD
jgi:hypothetical protein